jgi:hypothetical protein
VLIHNACKNTSALHARDSFRAMAISEQAVRALDGIDDVDWSALSHPYGSAEDVPDHLRGFLAVPDSDDAIEAGTFFGTYFVCQAIEYGDAAPHAVPFILRLLSAPGVSRRGELMLALVAMLRISIEDRHRNVEPSLKRAWIAAVARHPAEILAIAELLDGQGFEDAIDGSWSRRFKATVCAS